MHFANLFFAFLGPLPSAYMSHVFYLFSRWTMVFLYPARCRYALSTHAIYALYSLHLAMPKSRRVVSMLPRDTLFIVVL